MPEEDRADTGVRSVQVALGIIEMLAASEAEMGVTEIASRMGLTKGAVFRHLATLVERGYIVQDPASSRYGWGPRLYLLSRMGSARHDLLSLSEEPMRWLRDELDQTVVLSAATARSVVVLSTMPSNRPVEIGVRPGSELSLNASAQGKVALAFGPAALRERLIAGELPRFTERTITEIGPLDREVQEVRRQGWASAPGEVEFGINAIAVPVLSPGGELVATLAILGSMGSVGAAPTEAQREALQAASRRITGKLAPAPIPADPARRAGPRARR
ncbi:IclR family transcriptional regulator [Muricoccus radiodurans]|uniref:IclR family transcriptional regulator n=1 Tax=Muricoccus radiodurans TaxID=2231721 RepID=UPI003CE88E3D